MKYHISYEANPTHEDLQVLGDGIMRYANEMRGQEPLRFFAFFLRGEDEKIVGGCNGNNLYGCLYIDQLWIKDNLRGKGYGTTLMNEVEKLAKEDHCRFMVVNTMDWEALGFYKKLGFYVEFERKGFEKNSIFYFLRKDL